MWNQLSKCFDKWQEAKINKIWNDVVQLQIRNWTIKAQNGKNCLNRLKPSKNCCVSDDGKLVIEIKIKISKLGASMHLITFEVVKKEQKCYNIYL